MTRVVQSALKEGSTVMSRSNQAAMGLAGLALLALISSAQAQIVVAPGVGMAARTGVPVGMAGFGMMGVGAVPTVPAVGGFALSTVPTGNPYFGGGGFAATPYGGYGLSTVPSYGGGGYVPPYASPYSPYAGYGYGYQDPQGAYLQGIAAVTSATGQYFKDIQKARLTRYEANAAALDYAKKRVQHEAWLENQRYLSTQAVRDREAAARLESARKDAPLSDIWSGRALDELYKSIVARGGLSRGPIINLDEDTLRHINLRSKAASGNAGMLRDGGKLTWPVGLMDSRFKDSRELLSRKIADAVEAIKSGKSPEKATMDDIHPSFKKMRAILSDSNTADDMPVSQYLDAKRYLAQLDTAIRALSSPAETKKVLDNTYNAKGRTVAELVDNMRRDGLSFNAATPGDETAYTSLYYSLRAFEAGLGSSYR
jgi:hypothetical protein